jgi:hypothetical protein
MIKRLCGALWRCTTSGMTLGEMLEAQRYMSEMFPAATRAQIDTVLGALAQVQLAFIKAAIAAQYLESCDLRPARLMEIAYSYQRRQTPVSRCAGRQCADQIDASMARVIAEAPPELARQAREMVLAHLGRRHQTPLFVTRLIYYRLRTEELVPDVEEPLRDAVKRH